MSVAGTLLRSSGEEARRASTRRGRRTVVGLIKIVSSLLPFSWP